MDHCSVLKLALTDEVQRNSLVLSVLRANVRLCSYCIRGTIIASLKSLLFYSLVIVRSGHTSIIEHICRAQASAGGHLHAWCARRPTCWIVVHRCVLLSKTESTYSIARVASDAALQALLLVGWFRRARRHALASFVREELRCHARSRCLGHGWRRHCLHSREHALLRHWRPWGLVGATAAQWGLVQRGSDQLGHVLVVLMDTQIRHCAVS